MIENRKGVMMSIEKALRTTLQTFVRPIRSPTRVRRQNILLKIDPLSSRGIAKQLGLAQRRLIPLRALQGLYGVDRGA